jgi:putative membrane protein
MAPALAWEPAPTVLAGGLIALVLFVRGWRRLRARGRGDLASYRRALLFAGAVGLGVLDLTSPLHSAGEQYLLAAHMLQHVVVGDLVPVLLLLALRGPLLFLVVPLAAVRGRARRVLEALLRPSAALGLWIANLAAWHVPAVYGFAARHELVHAVEHGAFLGTGLLVWTQLIDPARRRRLTAHRSIAYACGVFVAGQMLVNALILSYRPLYPLYAEQPVRLLGLSPLEDQQAAALTMMIEQLLTLGIFVALRIRVLLGAPLAPIPERHPFAA